MTRRVVRAVLASWVLVGAAGLAGCSGADDDSAPAVREAASSVPSDVGDAASADADLDGEADPGTALTAEEFCDFLAEETPEVIDLQPPEYAAAVFGSALFSFYSEKGLLTDIDGTDMDALAEQGCPQAAAELLPVLGGDSFAQVISQ